MCLVLLYKHRLSLLMSTDIASSINYGCMFDITVRISYPDSKAMPMDVD